MKKYIPYILIVVLFLVVIFFYFNRTQALKDEIITIQADAKIKKELAQYYLDQYNIEKLKDNPLSVKYDSVINLLTKSEKTISTLKNQYYAKIQNVNPYTVLDMQQYWNNRYGTIEKSSNSRFDTIEKSH